MLFFRDLEELVKFKLQDSAVSKKPFPYAIKQLIAREIDTEKLRRNDTMPEIVQKETFKLPETPKQNASKFKVLLFSGLLLVGALLLSLHLLIITCQTCIFKGIGSFKENAYQ